MRNNENGRSMVEMLGVLAIIGVLSAGGLAGYSKAMFKHKLNNTMEQITMLVTNIRTHYGQQRNYSSISDANLIKLGIIPAIMGPAGSFTNPFKGDVEIDGSAIATDGGTAGTAFTVQYAGLPTEACIALSTSDFGSGAGSGFIGVEIGSGEAAGLYVGEVADDTEGTRGEGNAYKMADAVTECNKAANKDNATITWKFY